MHLLIILIIIPILFLSQFRCDLRFGKCAKVHPIFVEQSTLGGIWYEQKRADTLGEPGKFCNFVTMSLEYDSAGYLLHVNNTAYNGQKYRSTILTATQTDESTGSFRFEVPKWAPVSDNSSPNNFVLYLDDNFSICYSCQQVGVIKTELAWISSRQRFPDDRDYHMHRLEKELHKQGVNLKFDDVNQKACPARGPDQIPQPRSRKLNLLKSLMGL
ncbi:uncharacterized protein LOC142335145 [Convolutriloba macropyga]|uniref:uncharacterized protein LOC142335145 n=1 Tax=Convolutriloba macropyga TaxID=536237 RepID=UPI003F522561